MIFRFFRFALPLFLGLSQAFSAQAKDDSSFFRSIEGKWSGPGEIVAGKYKGTKFTCTLDGTTPQDTLGITMDGTCRVGVFSQEMKAVILRTDGVYKGAFLDGAAGKGLDIVSGNVTGDRVTMSLNRKKLNGAMLARIADPDTMHVTISVRVNKDMVRVIGMSLKRTNAGEPASTDTLAKN